MIAGQQSSLCCRGRVCVSIWAHSHDRSGPMRRNALGAGSARLCLLQRTHCVRPTRLQALARSCRVERKGWRDMRMGMQHRKGIEPYKPSGAHMPLHAAHVCMCVGPFIRKHAHTVCSHTHTRDMCGAFCLGRAARGLPLDKQNTFDARSTHWRADVPIVYMPPTAPTPPTLSPAVCCVAGRRCALRLLCRQGLLWH